MKSNRQSIPPFNPVAFEMGEPTLTWTARGTAAYQRISIALFLAGFATFSLLYCVQPLLPAFSSEFGIGAAQSSLALSVSTGLLAISILCAGALSERVGRRGLMFGSMTLAAAFNLAAAVAPSWHAILLARALEGFSLGGVPAVAMAYLAEEIDPRGLGFSMGLYVGGTAFGGMIGRVGMSIIAEYFSWRVAMMMIGVIDIAAGVAFVLLLPPSKNFARTATFNSRQHLKSWGLHLSHPRLPIVFAIGCLVMGIFVTIYNYASFRLIAPPFNLSTTETGLIFSAYVFGIVASSWAGALADRLGRGPVLATGSIIIAVGLVLTLSHWFLHRALRRERVGRTYGTGRQRTRGIPVSACLLSRFKRTWLGGRLVLAERRLDIGHRIHGCPGGDVPGTVGVAMAQAGALNQAYACR
jgi:MFS transporter, YNFM family, putative membrane transport protein